MKLLYILLIFSAMASSVKAACDASSAPTNGAVGDCTNNLANGATCQPKCNAGFAISGTSSCDAEGTLTAATCTACGSGSYSDSVDATTSCTSWTSCGNLYGGHISRLSGASTTAAGSCVDCAANTYAANGAAHCQPHTSCGTQTDNSARLSGASTTAAGSCDDCDSGSYAANGAANCQAWTSCGDQTDGTTRLSGASTTAAGSCDACDSGRIGNNTCSR